MKHSFCVLTSPSTLRAALVTSAAVTALLPVTAGAFSVSATPNALVPDGNDSGIVSILNVPATGATIQDVNVTLNLVGQAGGAWNGDLYIYVAHAGVLSVLANRPGVSGNNPFGYGDNGLALVTFDDSASLGDFHLYQVALNAGDSSLPITGTFQPDARLTDPSAVLPSDPRSAFLSGFQGQDPSGEWRLFIADLSLGGNVQLASWELNFETRVSVPDSGPGLAWIAFGTVLVGLASRRVRRSSAP